MKKNKEKSNNFHILMAKLCDFSYYNFPSMKCGNTFFKNSIFSEWYYYQLTDINENLNNSVFCAVNDEEKKVIIVFKGSEPSIFDIQKFITDWFISDIRMLFGKLPLNFADFLQYIATVKDFFKEYQIFMTGHSLGGSIAQLSAAVDFNSNIKTYTFNAFGTKHLLKCLEKENLSLSNDFSNITNFVVTSDIISNKAKHIGNVYYIKYNKSLINTIVDIIKELPKTLVNLPIKLLKSFKYYLKCLKFIIRKTDSHLMNNFTQPFEFQENKQNKKE